MEIKQTDFEILDKKYAMYVILAVYEYPGSTKTDIMRMEEGNEQTKFNRINDLIAAGILEYRTTGDGFSKKLHVSNDACDLVGKIIQMRKSLVKFESVRNDMETMKRNEESMEMLEKEIMENKK